MVKETLNGTDDFIPEPMDEVSQAIFDLGNIAGEWRETHDEKFVEEYYGQYQKLCDLGWKGYLDIEELLPDDLMPEDYLKRISK